MMALIQVLIVIILFPIAFMTVLAIISFLIAAVKEVL